MLTCDRKSNKRPIDAAGHWPLAIRQWPVVIFRERGKTGRRASECGSWPGPAGRGRALARTGGARLGKAWPDAAWRGKARRGRARQGFIFPNVTIFSERARHGKIYYHFSDSQRRGADDPRGGRHKGENMSQDRSAGSDPDHAPNGIRGTTTRNWNARQKLYFRRGTKELVLPSANIMSFLCGKYRFSRQTATRQPQV